MQTVRNKPRNRKSREERQQEALERGRRWKPNGNDSSVILQLTSRGIPAHDIETFGPGQNVFTYDAWRAQGRQVRKGEKSVRCTVWAPLVPLTDLIDETALNTNPEDRPRRKCRPVTACVFHISQTDAVNGNGKGGAS